MSYRITEHEKDVLRQAYTICREMAAFADGQPSLSAIKAANALSGVIVSVDSVLPSITQEDASKIDGAATVVASLLSGDETPRKVRLKAAAVRDAIDELKKDLEVKSE